MRHVIEIKCDLGGKGEIYTLIQVRGYKFLFNIYSQVSFSSKIIKNQRTNVSLLGASVGDTSHTLLL